MNHQLGLGEVVGVNSDGLPQRAGVRSSLVPSRCARLRPHAQPRPPPLLQYPPHTSHSNLLPLPPIACKRTTTSPSSSFLGPSNSAPTSPTRTRSAGTSTRPRTIGSRCARAGGGARRRRCQRRLRRRLTARPHDERHSPKRVWNNFRLLCSVLLLAQRPS